MRKGIWLALVLLGIGLVSAGSVLRQRLVFDDANRQVELAVGYRDMTKLASLSGMPVLELLDQLRAESRVQSVAIEEDTVGNWIDSGRLTGWQHPNNRFDLVATRPVDFQRLLAVLSAELGQRVSSDSKTHTVSIHADYDNLLDIGLGFDTEVATAIQARGFSLVPRLRQSVRPTPALIALKLKWASELAPRRPIIFDGVVALGYPFGLAQVSSQLRQTQTVFGVIEFTDQLGVPTLIRHAPGLAVKVHSLSDAEMENLSTDTVVNRYVRAVRERNVKLVFLKPFYYLPEDALVPGMVSANVAYFNLVARRVEQVATISPIQTQSRRLFPPVYTPVLFGLLVGVFGGVLLVVQSLGTRKVGWVLGGLSWGIVVIVTLFNPILGRQLTALLVAILAPSWAIYYVIHQPVMPGSVVHMLRSIFVAVLACAVGSILIVGLLSDQAFLVSGHQFLGVKLAFLVPLAVPTFYWIESRRQAETGPLGAVRDLLFAPVLTISLLGIIVGGGAIALYLIRSGNASALPPTGIERAAREWLEAVLSVRPRTKEMLIGYPALAVALLLPSIGRFSFLRWPLFLIGTTAFISVINSFCHGHTPVLISAIRGGLGLGIGVSIGLVGYYGWKGLKWAIAKI